MRKDHYNMKAAMEEARRIMESEEAEEAEEAEELSLKQAEAGIQ